MMERYIAIDYGEKRIGIAISDDTGIIIPYKTIKRERIFDIIDELCEEGEFSGIVIGNPMSGKRKKQIENFILMLKKRYSVKIIEWDESFTTKKAEEYLRELGKKPQKNKERIDKIAACFILKEFLEGI